TSSEHSIRESSLRGIVENSGAKSADFLTKILKSNETNLYPAAIGAINLLKDKQAIKKIADSLGDFPQSVQPLVINILAEKKENSLLAVAKKMADSPNEEARIASIKALGMIGDESAVDILIKIISNNTQPEKKFAIDSLKMLQGSKVDNEIVSQLKKSSPPALVDLINISVERNITAAIPELLKICASKEPDVKKKAFNAIGQLGEPSIIKDVVSIIINMENDAAQDEAVSAVVSLAEKIKDTKRRSSVVLDQWQKAKTDLAKSSLLRIAGGIGDDTALQFLSKIAQQDDQPRLQEIAIREISGWQDESAIPVLQGIYQKTKNQTYRTLAFRGYVRLLSSATKINTEEIIKHYEQALNSSQNPDEKKQILAGLGNVPNEKALAIALPLIEDNSVKSEAAQSILQISASIYGSNPSLAKTAINKVLASNIDENLTKQAKTILKQIETNIAYITLWEVAGPYFKEGNNYDALFNMVFPPEEGKTEVNWRLIPAGTNPKQPYIIDLLIPKWIDDTQAW
ncbi:MAG TPA: HEAT repeat domain-containing protein, partial [Verrucomicrobiota bacterium]|nr:HEAT repeat domain-containing protein [Verrucomicrobiota bacterium]